MKILKNFLKAITSRFVIISFLILIQFALFLVILLYFDIYFTYAHIVSSILSYLVLLYILNKDELSTYKIPWIIIVLLLPFAGSIAYIMYGSIVLPKKIRRLLQSEHDKIIDCVGKNPDIYNALKEKNMLAYGQATYISRQNHYSRNVRVHKQVRQHLATHRFCLLSWRYVRYCLCCSPLHRSHLHSSCPLR